MKNYYILHLLIVFSILFISCENYLDIKPKGYVVPSTVEDYERILNDFSLTKLLSDGIEKLSDDYYNPALEEGLQIQDADYRLYFWLNDPYTNASDLQYYSPWNILYNAIYQYNAVINGIDKASGGSQDRKDIAKGRALVGRAICYYYLNNIYGQIPSSTTDKVALGVPLVISNKLTDALPARSSTWLTFDFIVKDLKEGIQLLPTTSSTNYQINKLGAYGWLARTYLSMKEYSKAEEAANEVLKINAKLIDYNTQCERVESNTEEVAYQLKSSSTMKSPALHPENLHVIYFGYTRGMAFQNIANSLVELFDVYDLRRINIIPNEVPAGGKMNYMFMGLQSYEYSAGPTTAEMYLIKAESLARNKKITEALQTLNILRKTRIDQLHYQELSQLSEVATMHAILNERRRELLFRGVRWFDMRRLQNDSQYGFTAQHELGNGQFIKLEPNSPRYTMTIPTTAITQQIVQNP